MRMILCAAFAATGLLAQEFAPPKPTPHHLAMKRQVGTCKDDCRETTLIFDGPDMTGKTVTYKNVTVEKGPDHRVMMMYVKGKDGAFKLSMEIEYTRRK